MWDYSYVLYVNTNIRILCHQSGRSRMECMYDSVIMILIILCAN